MAFTPKFVDLVRNSTSVLGTANVVLGAAPSGYTGFAQACAVGDQFYYCIQGTDKPAEREVGRGTMLADGTILREGLGGAALTKFTSGAKTIALVAAGEWFERIEGLAGGDALCAAGRSALAAIAAPAAGTPRLLSEGARSGLFHFDAADRSAQVAADPFQGIYVAPASAPSGASGAWVRQQAGEVELGWFGVSPGASQVAARIESAHGLLGNRRYRLPPGTIALDRDVLFDGAPLEICGAGTCSNTSVFDAGTLVTLPAGKSGFVFKQSGGPAGAQRAKVADLAIYQAAGLATTATASFSTTAPATISITGGTNDYAVGQMVALEGAGPSFSPPGKSAAVAAGSNAVTITSAGGNPGVYVGQVISIAGAGLPAGTFVTAWTSTTITLSANATASVSGAAYTLKYPLVERIAAISGSTLTLEQAPSNSQNVTGGTLRHVDAGIVSNTVIDVDRVGINTKGIGLYLRGESGTGNADGGRFGNNNFASQWCGVLTAGFDGQINQFFNCRMDGPEIGFLDMSLIGNQLYGCHFAFNVGIACVLPGQYSAMFGCYFEMGTSYMAVSGYAFGCTGLRNQLGWRHFGTSDDGGTAPSFAVAGSEGMIGASYMLPSRCMYSGGDLAFRVENGSNSVPPGANGVGLNVFRNAGYVYLQAMQVTPSIAHAPLRVLGSGIDFRPGDTSVMTVSPDEVNLAGGANLKMSGQVAVNANRAFVGSGGVSTVGTIGYAAGAGGSVTQASDKTTGVTLNKLCGEVVMNAASLAAGAAASFTLSSSAIGANDEVALWIKGGATAGAYWVAVDQVMAGSCRVSLRNVSGAALAEAVTLGFAVRAAVKA